MEWSAASATKAYLETLQLGKTPEPRSNEFISALAAGMKSKLIVEVKSSVSPSTLALASAAKHTGAKFVCILPEAALPEVERESKDLGLTYVTDFSLVVCKNGDYRKLLNTIKVNPKRAVVVATNLSDDKQGLGAHIVGKKNKVPGMEITTIGKTNTSGRHDQGGGGHFGTAKSKWIVKVDEESGEEEHIFRVPGYS
ncbi:hypothetical protein ES332_A07G160300v1 [Gossypium tomentosum]|uniref:Uncharacterized protein n=1 Tax=Gossypium tomentosum TaxID=34277 RepID=A0A5D2PSY1_GOSTO|nr:hypothetical protein ES332_A07G160300v1 [Gossypium tomentosum]